MANKTHWDGIYSRQPADSVGWYQANPDLSLRMIASSGLDKHSRVIDVGCGASRLLNCLLDQGYKNLTGLDFSSQALQIAQSQAGERAGQVTWIEGDITQVELPADAFDIWHDRAVFHFFTQLKDRQKYTAMLRRVLALNGVAILATFAPDGPERCSGLEVQRYDAAGLLAELGPGFTLEEEAVEMHITPSGGRQAYTFARFRKTV